MNTKQTKVEITGTVHEVVMSYYDESITDGNIDLDTVIQNMESCTFFKKMLINPEQTPIFAENENYIIASIEHVDFEGNVNRLEAENEPLSATARKKASTVLRANMPTFPENQKSRFISCFVAEYPNVTSSFEINDTEFDANKFTFSKSGFNTLTDIVLNTMDYFQFLNVGIYDGEILDISIGNPSELNFLEFFIYDTETKQRVYERTWQLI